MKQRFLLNQTNPLHTSIIQNLIPLTNEFMRWGVQKSSQYSLNNKSIEIKMNGSQTKGAQKCGGVTVR